MSLELRTFLSILVLTTLLIIFIRRLTATYPKSYRRIKLVVLGINLITSLTVLLLLFDVLRSGNLSLTDSPLIVLIPFQVSLVFARLVALD